MAWMTQKSIPGYGETEETIDKGIIEKSHYFCFLRLQKVFLSLHITQIARLMADGVF